MDKADVSTSNDSSAPAPAASTSASNRGPKGGVMPPGAMPTTAGGGLSNVANEFWFPESRNCPCCKGYKHGCKCRVGAVDCCTNPECTTNTGNIESDIKIEPIKPRTKPKIVFKTAVPAPAPASTAAPVAAAAPVTAAPVAAAPVAASSPTAGAGGMCTFFNSAAGCRFGASCRFTHGPGGGGGAGGAPGGAPGGFSGPSGSPSGPASSQPCMFFQQGGCRNGTSCRFAHI
jgi:hypothetical protein